MSDCCKSKDKDLTPPPSPSILEQVKSYTPVFNILGLSFLGAVCLSIAGYGFMNGFMGLWFLLFGFLKLNDMSGFAKMFIKYDILAKKIPIYAKAFPIIEVILGLGFLSGQWIWTFAILTILLTTLSLVGIILHLRTGEKVACACVGSNLNVPLGPVAISENALMFLMALWMVI